MPIQQNQWYYVPLPPNAWANEYRFGMGSNPFSNVGNLMGTLSGMNGNFGIQDMMKLMNNGNLPWGAPGQMGMQNMMQPFNNGGLPFGTGMGGSLFGKGLNGLGSPLNLLGLVSSMFGTGSFGGIGRYFF